MTDEQATVATDVTLSDLNDLVEAFMGRNWVDVVTEHEGATHTFIFETPGGHLGVSIGVATGKGDVFFGVSEWEKQEHHELDGEWVWVRV